MSKTKKKKNTKKRAKSKKDPKKPDWIQSGFNKDTAVFPLRDLIGFAVKEICKDPDFKKKIKEMVKPQKKTSKKTQEPPLINAETHRVRPIAAANKKTRRRKSKRNSKRNRRRKSRRGRKSHRHKKQKGSARVGARDNIFSSVGVEAFQAEYRWFRENLPAQVDNMWRDICNHIASNPEDVYDAFSRSDGRAVERILPRYSGLTRALTIHLSDTTAYERFVWYMWTLHGGMYTPLGNRLRTIDPRQADAEFATILPALTSLTMKGTIPRAPTPVPPGEPILWRGVSRGWLNTQHLLSYGNWSHDCSNDLNDNMVIQDKGYVATSPERHTAESFMNPGGALFGIMGSIRIEPNTLVITKERSISTTQHNIQTISEFAGESECLLNRAGFFITDCQGSHRWTWTNTTNDIPIYTVWYLDGQHLGEYVFGMIIDKLQHITRNSISRESLLQYIDVFPSGSHVKNSLSGFVDRMHGHTLSSSFAHSLDIPIGKLRNEIIHQREGERIDRIRRDRRERDRRERDREERLRRERDREERLRREREQREQRGRDRRRSSPIQAPQIQVPQIQAHQGQQSDIAAAVAGLDDLFTPGQMQAAQQAQQAQAGDDSLFAPLWRLMGY